MATLIFPALFFAATVLGQCSTSGTTTITASADATALASCTTYSGSVAIPTGLAVPKDNDGLQVLRVDNIRKITGNLTVTNIGELASLTFSSLQSVVGFELGALERLVTLSFPQLDSCDALNFTALPSLQTLDFGAVGITKARSVLITNTGLSSLNGIENLKEVDLFNVNNNQALANISLLVTSIKNSLNVEANDGFVSGLSTSFPLLETAQNMTFRNCSQILLPALKNVTDELGFYGNTFTNLSTPKLTSAGGIIFVDNTELINITMPNLEKIDGALQIANNTKLATIDGFPKLSVIEGTLDFSGNFSEVELPALTRVRGAFNMQTSVEDFDCSPFDEAKDNSLIRGEYTCEPDQATPGTAGTRPESNDNDSGSSGTNAAAPMDLKYSLVLGGTVLVASILQLIV